jgi:hypothetical protein
MPVQSLEVADIFRDHHAIGVLSARRPSLASGKQGAHQPEPDESDVSH